MNKCRGVIASRHYHSPARVGTYSDFPRFLVLPLSEKRSRQLIRKSNLKPQVEVELKGKLRAAKLEIRSMASKHLCLSLLCRHVQEGPPFPENVHIIFETFIESRLTRDKDRLWQRFQLDTTTLREGAESIAFCMTVDPALGLSPTREKLEQSVELYGSETIDDLDTLLNALEYTKLARSGEGTNFTQSKSFTFAHRRFQEYFATCVVLKNPTWVSSNELLTDARWRETTVVMCQTQPTDELEPVVQEALRLLRHFRSSLPEHLLVRFYGFGEVKDSTKYTINSIYSIHFPQEFLPIRFPCPPKFLHLLGLLQDGFSRRLADLPDNCRLFVGQLVLTSYVTGLLPDRKWALEVSSTAPEFVLEYLLRSAFSNGSQWIKEVAFL